MGKERSIDSTSSTPVLRMSFGERLGASLFHLKNRLFPYTVRVGDLTVPSSDLPYSRKEEQLMHQEAERKLDERTRKLKSKLSD